MTRALALMGLCSLITLGIAMLAWKASREAVTASTVAQSTATQQKIEQVSQGYQQALMGDQKQMETALENGTF